MNRKICYVVTIGRTIKAFFEDQIIYLSNNGFDITVVCNNDCELSKELPCNIKLFDVPIPRGIDAVGSLKALRQIREIFHSNQFDLIQYSTPNAALLASIAARAEKAPIRNYHLMGLRYEGEHGIKRSILKAFEKISCRNSTHIECVCESTRLKGISEGLFSKDKAVVVGNGSTGGVNRNKFNLTMKQKWRNEVRAALEISGSAVVFGFAGRIAFDKGICELFDSWKMIIQGNNNIKLLMVGPVEDQELLEIGKNINHVFFTGKVDDVERYYSAMDVLVLPSYREGFGNVLIEAETMGVPCIASDIEGPRDAMVDGKTGLLFPCRSVDALKHAMVTMLDEKKRLEFSQNAVDFSAGFDSKVLCEHIMKRKKSLIENRG